MCAYILRYNMDSLYVCNDDMHSMISATVIFE